MFFESLAYAMGGMAPGGATPEGGNPLGAFLPLILMFAIFYFLLIRPQQKKQKQHREMLASLKRGDHVLTGGGIYGRITAVADDVLTVEIGDGLSIKINRSFISGLAEGNAPKSEPKKEKKNRRGGKPESDEKAATDEASEPEDSEAGESKPAGGSEESK